MEEVCKKSLKAAGLVFIAIAMVFCSIPSLAPVSAGNRTSEKRIIVKFKDEASQENKEKLEKENSLIPRKKIKAIGLEVYESESQLTAENLVSKLKQNPEVEFAEIDELRAPDYAPNDPSLNSQWYIAKIGAPQAWDMGTGNGAIVAVCDTGVFAAHPELSGRVVAGWNVFDNNSDTSDIQGHGTFVAGIIAAEANNLQGIAGIVHGAKVMPIRITSDPGGWAYFSDMADCAVWAADHGAKVANISYDGAPGSATVASAARYMESKGGVVVVAAGNSNSDKSYTVYNEIIVAAGTDSADARASFSNYGANIDIAAPAVSMLTTNRSGSYSYVSGTSFASPTVAAVAALIKAYNPSLDSSDIKDILNTTAKDLGTAGWDQYFGFGRVDAAAALSKAVVYVKQTDQTPPTVSISSPADGQSVPFSFKLYAAATDNVGITKMTCYLNGSPIASANTSIITCSYNLKKMAAGTYTLKVTAEDAAGNSGLSAVNVVYAGTTRR